MGFIGKKAFIIISLCLIGFNFSGCGTGQINYVLGFTGTAVVSDAPGATSKFGAVNLHEAPINGNLEILVTFDDPQGLQVQATSLNATAQLEDFNIQLVITPQLAEVNEENEQIDNSGFYSRRVNGNAPILSTQSIHTSVIISDGQTIALGGLNYESKEDDANQLPILGDIPIIGFLFKNKQKQMELRNLMILVTPTLVDALEE